MQSRTIRRWFTLVEILIAMTMVTVLTAIGIQSYMRSAMDARDTSRIADMWRLKTALRTEFEKKSAYPLPGGKTWQIVHSGASNVLATQGWADTGVSLQQIDTTLFDPYSGTPYAYSVTRKKNQYQTFATIENGGKPRAYVLGDFKTVSKDMLPSLGLAANLPAWAIVEIANGIGSGSTNRTKFITHESYANLPYLMDGTTATWSETSYSGVLAGNVPINSSYATCQQIYEAGQSYGSGIYQTRDGGGNMADIPCALDGASIDSTPPTIFTVTSSSPSCGNMSFTISAWDETALHATAYSFDAGASWQAASVKTYSGTSLTKTGTDFRVRDNAGNMTIYGGIPVSATAASCVVIVWSCGTDNGTISATTPTNLCTAGTPGTVLGTAGVGPYQWTCAWSGGGATATCHRAIYAATKYTGCNTFDIVLYGGATWAACNVGATTAAIGAAAGASYTLSTMGYLYQWGNNGAMTNVTATSTTKPNAGGYAASTYSSTTPFIVWSADWSSVANPDLWGDTTNTVTARKGPCIANYHVPTRTETLAIQTALGSSATAMATLYLPYTGHRGIFSPFIMEDTWYGYFWSSSTDGTNGYYVFYTTAYQDFWLNTQWNAVGTPVRCIHN